MNKNVSTKIYSPYKNKVFDKYLQIPENNKSGSIVQLAIHKEFIET